MDGPRRSARARGSTPGASAVMVERSEDGGWGDPGGSAGGGRGARPPRGIDPRGSRSPRRRSPSPTPGIALGALGPRAPPALAPGRLGRDHRPSAGKTTTKELIRAALLALRGGRPTHRRRLAQQRDRRCRWTVLGLRAFPRVRPWSRWGMPPAPGRSSTLTRISPSPTLAVVVNARQPPHIELLGSNRRDRRPPRPRYLARPARGRHESFRPAGGTTGLAALATLHRPDAPAAQRFGEPRRPDVELVRLPRRTDAGSDLEISVAGRRPPAATSGLVGKAPPAIDACAALAAAIAAAPPTSGPTATRSAGVSELNAGDSGGCLRGLGHARPPANARRENRRGRRPQADRRLLQRPTRRRWPPRCARARRARPTGPEHGTPGSGASGHGHGAGPGAPAPRADRGRGDRRHAGARRPTPPRAHPRDRRGSPPRAPRQRRRASARSPRGRRRVRGAASSPPDPGRTRRPAAPWPRTRPRRLESCSRRRGGMRLERVASTSSRRPRPARAGGGPGATTEATTEETDLIAVPPAVRWPPATGSAWLRVFRYTSEPDSCWPRSPRCCCRS